MTSNLKRKLGGMLTVAVLLCAAEARAQSLEKPGAPPPPEATAAAASPAGPAGFGDAGQLVISSERLFGYSWRHRSQGAAHDSQSSFSLLANPEGIEAAGYTWPRLGFDYFFMKGISLGAAASFFRQSGIGAALSGYEVAPRIGYATMVGPWLGVWPRLGYTYVHASTVSFSAITAEVPLVIVAYPHLAFLVTPALDLGVSGTGGSKITDIGLTFGLALTF
jgi:hypothetical protein